MHRTTVAILAAVLLLLVIYPSPDPEGTGPRTFDAGHRQGDSQQGGADPSPDRTRFDTDLMAHWDFDEESGNTAADITGNGHDGAVMGAEWKKGWMGGALNFRGSTDEMDVGETLINGWNGMTFLAWIYHDVPHTSVGHIGGTIFSGMNVDNGKLEVQVQSALNGYCRYISDSQLFDQRWYCVAGVYDGTSSSIKIYVDGDEWSGNLIDIIPATIYSTTDPFKVGSGTYPFTGLIDDVQLYNRALTQSEVYAHYISTKGAISLWDFNEGDGNVAKDHGDFSNDADIRGGEWTEGRCSAEIDRP